MPDYIELTYDSIEAETLKAILFNFGDEQAWIPRSQIENDSCLSDYGDTVCVAAWLAKQKGLEKYEA